MRASSKRHYDKNPLKYRLKNRLKRYNLSEQEFANKLIEQLGVCAVCKQPETVKQNGKWCQLSIDHNHATHKARGLLCRACNSSIGMVKDSPVLLRKLAEYLESWEIMHAREIV
mgnify:FL=1